ncbi:type VII secretion protein EccB [Mycobacterium celatum]|uniref:Type VII secretion protein EccB n=1 Tax=Mycobacterium celatum TaxID=28045 RepID=A0A1X1RIT5_MYCCE|nr:type VII secretion protein EccB [Mycobacterium celatum]ORV06993.1 type VII secretion protein EccB [Mycobacterium celatum]PIB78194.1 type VII secretion protein EccB [Mycobacterium celatum]
MPLNLSNRDQNSGHLFYNRRLRAAITRYSVQMKHDDRKQQAALVLSVVFAVLGAGWMALLHFMKPAGLVGQSALIGDRDTGAVYAKIDGRLYPALNLTSARLAVGNAGDPTWVRAAEIARYPSGPMIGIPGIPDNLTVRTASTSAWSICDTAAPGGSTASPVVTSIAGELPDAAPAVPIRADQAILVTHRESTYVIWGGHRSRIDPAERSVTFNLGLDPGVTRAIGISNALFDAMPATEPIAVPPIPEAGTPSTWLTEATVGSVLETRDANGVVNGFYVLLSEGVQKINGFVADLLRTADPRGIAAPRLVSPGKLVNIPTIDKLNVDYYPTGKLTFVDTAASPVTCLTWTKQPGDRQAAIRIVSGRRLPVPVSMDSHVVSLVRDDRSLDSVEADQTLVLPGAANLVATTSGVVTSDSRESLYWLSPQGVRYGIQWDKTTLHALALNPRGALQAPWSIIRTFAPGPAISRENALVARDTIDGGAVAPVTPYSHEVAEG